MRDPGRCSLFLFSHHKLYCKVDFTSLMYPMSRLVFNEVVEEEHLPSWVALEEHPWVVWEASPCLEAFQVGLPFQVVLPSPLEDLPCSLVEEVASYRQVDPSSLVLPLEASPFQVVPMIQAVVACPGILVALEDPACLRALEVLAWVALELPLTLKEVQVALDESLEG